MRQVRFHKEIYRGEAVDEAVKTLARYAKFELTELPDAWLVALSCKKPERERAVAGELAGHALGLTVKQRGGVR